MQNEVLKRLPIILFCAILAWLFCDYASRYTDNLAKADFENLTLPILKASYRERNNPSHNEF